MPKVLFACSKGTESAEFTCSYDILKRAGADLTIAKVKENDRDTEKFFVTAQNLRVLADNFIDEVKDNTYDMIVCPGGLPNAQIVGKNKTLIEMLKKQKSAGRWHCAICDSPFEVFESNGLLEGEKGTGYPGYGKFKDESKLKERVVISNKCVTSMGPCSAFEFGFTLCELLFGKDKKEELQAAMVFKA
jgi:4-methyl-5(b-hydroxyethyl)-thiazole monophosphate biosynthesis